MEVTDNHVCCTHLFILEVGEFSMSKNTISILPALEGGRDEEWTRNDTT